MTGLLTLILILSPMFVGFLAPNHPNLMRFSEKMLNYLVFLLLIVIGIELGLVKNLSQQIGNIALYLSCLMILTLGLGTLSLLVFDRLSPCQYRQPTSRQNVKPKTSIQGSLLQLVCLAGGFLLARFLSPNYLPPSQTTTVLLMLLLFFVGVSLKGSGISLKQVLINKRGVQVSLIFMVSTLIGGVIFSLLFLEVSLAQGLALASGFGWYSLSGSIMTDAYGAVWGSVALLNDLGREVLALLFIPILMRYSTSAGIGLGGVTSLDFTLPTILQSSNPKIMPLVISFGFITNIISPILMVFFSSFGL